MKKSIKALWIDLIMVAIYCATKVILCLWDGKPIDWADILLVGAAVAIPYYFMALLLLYTDEQVKIKKTNKEENGL